MNNCPGCGKERDITDVSVTVVSFTSGDYYIVECNSCDFGFRFSSIRYDEMNHVGGLLEVIVKKKWNLETEKHGK
jgi:hypothetical protein